MSARGFTGERLHGDEALFAVDLARHRAAYAVARERAGEGWLLDLGSGSGHGCAWLAAGGVRVLGLDRVAPDPSSRREGARFVRGDLCAPPFAPGRFARIASFQVIEHFADPTTYLDAVAGLLAPGGEALLTTPNRLRSDGVNPFHLREYSAEELAARLRARFESVELLGIGATPRVRRYFEARARRVRRILRLDPLRLRERLPRALVERLFAILARRVRHALRRREPLADATWRDYPVGPPDADCLDLLAICRGPRRESSPPSPPA